MDLWNNNNEFRKEYIRCNVRRILKRLRTLDGYPLGPNEESPVIPQVLNERVAKDLTVVGLTSEERTQEKVLFAKAEKANCKPVAKAMKQKGPLIAKKAMKQKLRRFRLQKLRRQTINL